MRPSSLSQHRLGWLLSAPAVCVMLLVTGWPMLYAIWLSMFRYDLRFPDERAFVGVGNYLSVLAAEEWWEAVSNTLLITGISVALELVLGFVFALVMHRALVGRRIVRTSLLVPYGIITVVAAMSWRFAFDPTTGFINPLLGLSVPWLADRGSALVVIILTEVWKTTPFMALLLLAGLASIPEDLLWAARVDGASAWQRFFRVVLPQMRGVIGVALLFRTLDAFRIFDTVFVQTRGAQGTDTLSIIGYNTLITRLNLGLGSAVSMLIFICMLAIAILYIRGFRIGFTRGELP